MRLRIPGSRARTPLVHACQWPRSIYTRQGHLGGLKTARITEAMQKRDLAEVRAYLQDHPGATIPDVAMCCFMSNGQAERLMRFYIGICDEVVVLKSPGWQESRGIKCEIAIAEALDKPVSYMEPV